VDAKQNVEHIVSVLRELTTREDLKVVRDALKEQFDVVDAMTALKFRVGDKVEWDSRKRGGHVKTGTVVRVNQKSVSVFVPEGPRGIPEKWKVHPSFLRKVA
jgi:hypothetical protein